MRNRQRGRGEASLRAGSAYAFHKKKPCGRLNEADAVSGRTVGLIRRIFPGVAQMNMRTVSKSNTPVQDYGTCRLSRKETVWSGLLFLGLDALIAVLFYRSAIAFLILLPLAYPFFRMRQEELGRMRSREMLAEFTTGMQLVNASLQAGYAIENAFREALVQLRKIYPEDAFILREFRYILSQMDLSVPVESLLLDLGRRTHIGDILDMAEVFQTAKRTGGDMISIIRGAVTSIQAKAQTQSEIEANLSGKASEQKILSAAPLGIIAYISLTSPGFLDVCYHSPAGVLIMTAALVVYGAAFLWGRKIMRIEV